LCQRGRQPRLPPQLRAERIPLHSRAEDSTDSDTLRVHCPDFSTDASPHVQRENRPVTGAREALSPRRGSLHRAWGWFASSSGGGAMQGCVLGEAAPPAAIQAVDRRPLLLPRTELRRDAEPLQRDQYPGCSDPIPTPPLYPVPGKGDRRTAAPGPPVAKARDEDLRDGRGQDEVSPGAGARAGHDPQSVPAAAASAQEEDEKRHPCAAAEEQRLRAEHATYVGRLPDAPKLEQGKLIESPATTNSTRGAVRPLLKAVRGALWPRAWSSAERRAVRVLGPRRSGRGADRSEPRAPGILAVVLSLGLAVGAVVSAERIRPAFHSVDALRVSATCRCC